jgi:23S rRNA (guanosine2251-2'-O)-methyltransferase
VFLGGAERGERRGEVARAAERAGVPVQAADRETLDTLARGRPHQGVAALVDDYPYLSLRDFDRLLEEAAHDLLVVALDRVQDPQNLGAVLRSCAAFGVDVVVVPERRAAGVTEAVVRASAGASEWVPVARVPNLAEVLRRCERKGLQVVAVDPRGEERVSEAGLAPPLVLVLGGEGPGLRRLTLERSHRRVRIRIAGALGSINLSVAAGIVLHQIRNAEPDPPIELPGPAECGTRDP